MFPESSAVVFLLGRPDGPARVELRAYVFHIGGWAGAVAIAAPAGAGTLGVVVGTVLGMTLKCRRTFGSESPVSPGVCYRRRGGG